MKKIDNLLKKILFNITSEKKAKEILSNSDKKRLTLSIITTIITFILFILFILLGQFISGPIINAILIIIIFGLFGISFCLIPYYLGKLYRSTKSPIYIIIAIIIILVFIPTIVLILIGYLSSSQTTKPIKNQVTSTSNEQVKHNEKKNTIESNYNENDYLISDVKNIINKIISNLREIENNEAFDLVFEKNKMDRARKVNAITTTDIIYKTINLFDRLESQLNQITNNQADLEHSKNKLKQKQAIFLTTKLWDIINDIKNTKNKINNLQRTIINTAEINDIINELENIKNQL
ncbi:MAG: hypothetical protein PHS54_02350 [Clostridia bacterium]|nr:hypothetical protein [Clostridia bacterium]